jgi:hypothetical protein
LKNISKNEYSRDKDHAEIQRVFKEIFRFYETLDMEERVAIFS